MFDTATWKKKNRRAFAVRETLAQRVGAFVSIGLDGHVGETDAQRAAALVANGLTLLQVMIEDPPTVDGSKRKVKRESC